MEFHYYGSEDDKISMLKKIVLHTELNIIPVLNYYEKKPLFIRNIDSNIEVINKAGQFYLWGPELYPAFPLGYGSRGGGWGYYLRESPCLILNTPYYVENKDGERIRCINGVLSHSKQVIDLSTEEIIPIQEGVINAYKVVLKLMKGNMKKVAGRSLWIGYEAYELFKEGKLEVPYQGKWISGDNQDQKC